MPPLVLRQLNQDLSEEAEAVLLSMYSADRLPGSGGKPVLLDSITRISANQGAELHHIVRHAEVTRSLEIGFAYGFSTVWILDALRGRSAAHHTAVDPFQLTHWGGVGLEQVRQLNAPARFEWIGEKSIVALAALIKDGAAFDFIFIDGNHRYDDVLVDFYLSDQLAKLGGIIAFDDLWMPSVRTALSFILRNRHYEVVSQYPNMIVLRKLKDDDRDWRHFQAFKIHKIHARPNALRHYLRRAAQLSGTLTTLRSLRRRFAPRRF